MDSLHLWNLHGKTIYFMLGTLPTTPIQPLKEYARCKTLWKAMKVHPLHDGILKLREDSVVYLPTHFQKHFTHTIQTWSACPVRSVSRCIWCILNIIISISSFASHALTWHAQLYSQHLKGLIKNKEEQCLRMLCKKISNKKITACCSSWSSVFFLIYIWRIMHHYFLPQLIKMK